MKEIDNNTSDYREATRTVLRPDDSIVVAIYSPEVISHIANMAAETLNEMIIDIDPAVTAVIVISLDESEPEDMFESLRMLFMVGGEKAMTKCLDILKIIENYDEDIYEEFKDSFLSTDVMDWWLEDIWLNELTEEGGNDVRS